MNKKYIEQIKVVEFNFKQWITKNYQMIFLGVILLFSIAFRAISFRFCGGDLSCIIDEWYGFLMENGKIFGLKELTIDHGVAYKLILAIITYIPINPFLILKLINHSFEFLMVLACALIVKELTKTNKNFKNLWLFAIIGILILPTIFLDTVIWGQNDCIYLTFVFLGVLNLIKEKVWFGFLLISIGIAFKSTALLTLPLLIIFYILNKKVSFLNFLIMPLTIFISGIPLLLVGAPFSKITERLIFATAGPTKDSGFGRIANIYATVAHLGINLIHFKFLGILLTVFLLGLGLFFLIKYNCICKGQNIILILFLTILVCTYFLPGMIERYTLLIDIASFIYFIVRADWKNWYIPLGVNLFSLVNYIYALNNLILDQSVMCIFIAISIIYLFFIGFIITKVFKDIIEYSDKNKNLEEI